MIKHCVSWSRVVRRPVEISWGISGPPDPRRLMNVPKPRGKEREALVKILRMP